MIIDSRAWLLLLPFYTKMCVAGYDSSNVVAFKEICILIIQNSC